MGEDVLVLSVSHYPVLFLINEANFPKVFFFFFFVLDGDW